MESSAEVVISPAFALGVLPLPSRCPRHRWNALQVAIGPFFFSPASEMIGRAPMLKIGCTLFLVLNLACAFTRTHFQFGALRFCSGIFAGAPVGLSQVILAELWGTKRGRPLCLISLATVIGPCMGTMIGNGPEATAIVSIFNHWNIPLIFLCLILRSIDQVVWLWRKWRGKTPFGSPVPLDFSRCSWRRLLFQRVSTVLMKTLNRTLFQKGFWSHLFSVDSILKLSAKADWA